MTKNRAKALTGSRSDENSTALSFREKIAVFNGGERRRNVLLELRLLPEHLLPICRIVHIP
jgi:hypothetical protein